MIFFFFRRTNIGITTKITITATALLTSLYAGRTYSCQAFSSSVSTSSSSLFSLLPQQQQQQYRSPTLSSISTSLRMSTTLTTSTGTTTIPTWDELQTRISSTSVGKALNDDSKLRLVGKGSPNVHSKLRLFDSNDTSDSDNTETKYTIYRDHAGWCPYCQKTMLLIEAKEIPITIELINMRSYGDKSSSFLRKVPNGLLPALENNDSGKVTLDSAYIMEFLENEYNKNWNGENKNIKKVMVPDSRTQPEQFKNPFIVGDT